MFLGLVSFRALVFRARVRIPFVCTIRHDTLQPKIIQLTTRDDVAERSRHVTPKFKDSILTSIAAFCKFMLTILFCLPAFWSNSNAFVFGAEDLRFKSWADQIGRSVINGSPPLLHFFARICVAR